MRLITYASTACKPFLKEDLEDLLHRSRENNAKFNISGLLLYKGGNFMQAIEGPDQAVEQLYFNIQADTTHYNVTTILDEPIHTRSFADWSMGFMNMDGDQAVNMQGISNLLHDTNMQKVFSASSCHAKQLLSTFCQVIR